ncbi:hypothetical protein WKH55_20520 [Pantoea agglomerans]|uniref:hypothetical protein n=1 Tax=Enterobacter agglomerans TaxID=549 RepID=UPI001AA05260|nr:hypothetical protein [Pantoea agglomerans]QTC52567.1 hypothetical protein H0Z11_20730 [Pantoea agglomerans]
MLTLSGAARTFIVWLTLFFAWSAIVLWQFGPDIVKTIMSHSQLFAWDLTTRMVQGDMMPPGIITLLLFLLVLTAGCVMSALTLACWNLAIFTCGIPVIAGFWLLRRTGLIRTPASVTLK